MSYRPAVLFGIVLAVAGCHNDSQQAPAASQPKASKKPVVAPAIVDETADMVEAATTGKSTAPVELRFSLGRRPAVGQAQNVAVALTARVPAESATVQIGESPGLAIADSDRQFVFEGLTTATVYRHDVVVTPIAGGVSYLMLTVALRHDELTETRTFSVPLIVNGDRASTGSIAARK